MINKAKDYIKSKHFCKATTIKQEQRINKSQA